MNETTKILASVLIEVNRIYDSVLTKSELKQLDEKLKANYLVIYKN